MTTTPEMPGTAAGDGTRAVRAGLPTPVKYEPTLPGPVFAAHYHLPGEPIGPYTYGRDTNPTWTHLEAAISELESPGSPPRRSPSPPAWQRSPRSSSPRPAPGTRWSSPTTGTRHCRSYANSWRRTASRCAPRRPVATRSCACWTAPGCCGSRPRPTRVSTSATYGGSWLPRTRAERWSPSTTPSRHRSGSNRWISARTSPWRAAPRA